jgi:hypothetical protein
MVTAALAVLFCAGSAQAVALDDPLTISPPADITTAANMPCGASYSAQVSFSFTASGGMPPYGFVCNFYSGNVFLVGSTTVSCLTQDFRGNSTPMATFTVTVTPFVRDTTPPVFQNVPPIVVTADSSGRAVLSYPLPTATDNADGPVPVHCDPWHGGPDGFPLGMTTATCTATDSQGNTATTTFTITVNPAGTTTAPPPPTAPPTTTSAGPISTTPAPPPPTSTTTSGTTVTTTVAQPTTTSAPATPVEQSLQDRIDALSTEIAALTDRMARLAKASDAASLAYQQAIQAGDNPAIAAAIARGTGMNVIYGLGDFAP